MGKQKRTGNQQSHHRNNQSKRRENIKQLSPLRTAEHTMEILIDKNFKQRNRYKVEKPKRQTITQAR